MKFNYENEHYYRPVDKTCLTTLIFIMLGSIAFGYFAIKFLMMVVKWIIQL